MTADFSLFRFGSRIVVRSIGENRNFEIRGEPLTPGPLLAPEFLRKLPPPLWDPVRVFRWPLSLDSLLPSDLPPPSILDSLSRRLPIQWLMGKKGPYSPICPQYDTGCYRYDWSFVTL